MDDVDLLRAYQVVQSSRGLVHVVRSVRTDLMAFAPCVRCLWRTGSEAKKWAPAMYELKGCECGAGVRWSEGPKPGTFTTVCGETVHAGWRHFSHGAWVTCRHCMKHPLVSRFAELQSRKGRAEVLGPDVLEQVVAVAEGDEG